MARARSQKKQPHGFDLVAEHVHYYKAMCEANPQLGIDHVQYLDLKDRALADKVRDRIDKHIPLHVKLR